MLLIRKKVLIYLAKMRLYEPEIKDKPFEVLKKGS